MKYFSIPSDFKKETIDDISKLNQEYSTSKVIETYGQLTDSKVVSSGRISSVLPQVGLKQLEKYVDYSIKNGVDFNYTLNPSCFGNYEFTSEGIREIKKLLSILNEIGITSLTVTLPSLIEIINSLGITFEIKASAICEVISPDKALFYKKLGAKRIVTDPDITRDFDRLEGISKAFGDGVEIIINNVCLKNCAYKMFHYNHEAHCNSQNSSQDITEYYFSRCSMQKAENFINFMRINWIRPEDLIYYDQTGIRYYKIQGRQNILSGNILRTLTHYMNEDFDGNLFDLITLFAPYNSFQPYIDNKKLEGFVQTFYEDRKFCKNICNDCMYCDMFAKKTMNLKETMELQKKTKEFYEEYDKFTKKITEIPNEKLTRRLFKAEELELDLSDI